MHKLVFLLILVLFNHYIASSQKYYPCDTAKGEYEYQYCFSFEHKRDTSSYKLTQTITPHQIKLRIVDNRGEVQPLIAIQVTNTEDKTSKYIFTDIHGIAKAELKKGAFLLSITNSNYDHFKLEFSITNLEGLYLDLKLGLGPELTIYQIHSKKKLSKKEILEIIQCIRHNQHISFARCSKQGQYYISIQI
ncbi:hypothetical protein BKI52_40485 [marine bacterium AO1-C]|nr:hypothetical protein BKI52_40485 [marine bacterium AO1-C]